MILVNAQTADGSSADAEFLGSREYGQLNLYVTGNLGGGTLTLEAKAPDNAYVPIQTLSVGMVSLKLSPMVYRLTLAGATTPNYSAYAEADSEFTQDQVRSR